MSTQDRIVQPQRLRFRDDGSFPNSVLPVLLYRQVLSPTASNLAAMFERHFAANNWKGAWRNGVYPYAHYHSTTHEVLGVFRGETSLQLGGERNGAKVRIRCGDVLVISAGVAHQNLTPDSDLGVVGAYPDGREWDVLRGSPEERLLADRNLAEVPIPDTDPLYGSTGPLPAIWRAAAARVT